MIDANNQLVAGISADLAVELLVKEYGHKLFTLGLKFCRNPDEAQEMVQEVFYQAYKSWDTFKGDAQVTTWLYTIASRVCAKMHTKRAGEPDRMLSLSSAKDEATHHSHDIPAEQDTPLEIQLRHESEQLILHAIANLPEKYRMPIIMKDMAGLSIQQVAQVLDTPEPTIKTHLHRGRNMVQESLENIHNAAGEIDPTVWTICRDLYAIHQKAKTHDIQFSLPDYYCENCTHMFQQAAEHPPFNDSASVDFCEEICTQVIHNVKTRG